MRNETKLCKYCQTEIPMKAKVCPNCRKKQRNYIKDAVLYLLAILVIFAIIGSIGDDNDSKSEDRQIDINQTENKTDNEVIDSEFEVKEYLYENTIGDTICFVIIKNNSKQDVSVSANATAKDSNGNSIGADEMDINIIGSGETSIGCFYFNNVKNIDKVDYKINYNKSYYKPIINSLSIEQTLNDKNVILSATNNSAKPALFVQAYALFIDSQNNVVYYDSAYITDNDSEIKPEDTISIQLDSYKEYDHVEIYFTGRASG